MQPFINSSHGITNKSKMDNEKWIRDNRQWSDYPAGTKAKALMGGYWVKLQCGRWQWPGGCSFPTPGGDATGEVCLPFIDVYNKLKANDTTSAGTNKG